MVSSNNLTASNTQNARIMRKPHCKKRSGTLQTELCNSAETKDCQMRSTQETTAQKSDWKTGNHTRKTGSEHCKLTIQVEATHRFAVCSQTHTTRPLCIYRQTHQGCCDYPYLTWPMQGSTAHATRMQHPLTTKAWPQAQTQSHPYISEAALSGYETDILHVLPNNHSDGW